MNNKAAFWIAVAAILIAALYYTSHQRSRDITPLKAIRPAPEIVGEDIDGQPMKLSDFRGKVVFLDFWGNW